MSLPWVAPCLQSPTICVNWSIRDHLSGTILFANCGTISIICRSTSSCGAHQELQGQPRAFVYRDDAGVFLVPLILRPIDDLCPHTPPHLDAVAPYGYASPILQENRSQDVNAFLTRALAALVASLLEHRVITAFFRLHPLLPIPLEPLQEIGTLVKHGETVVCDLSQTSQELWSQTRRFVRQGIEKARKSGLVAQVDDAWTSLEDFIAIYTDTMQRVEAEEYYFFGRDCFTGMRDKLGGTMHLLTVRDGSQVICGGIFSETCRIVQAHLMGTRSGYERSDAPKLLMAFAREWAKDRGNEFLHLGGGLGGGNDSLFFFKSGFSKLQMPFYTWRVVVDPENYQGIIARWEARSGTKANSAGGFFPPYRLPPQSVGAVNNATTRSV